MVEAEMEARPHDIRAHVTLLLYFITTEILKYLLC